MNRRFLSLISVWHVTIKKKLCNYVKKCFICFIQNWNGDNKKLIATHRLPLNTLDLSNITLLTNVKAKVFCFFFSFRLFAWDGTAIILWQPLTWIVYCCRWIEQDQTPTSRRTVLRFARYKVHEEEVGAGGAWRVAGAGRPNSKGNWAKLLLLWHIPFYGLAPIESVEFGAPCPIVQEHDYLYYDDYCIFLH